MCVGFSTPSQVSAMPSWVFHSLTQFCHYPPRKCPPGDPTGYGLSPTRLSLSPFRCINTCGLTNQLQIRDASCAPLLGFSQTSGKHFLTFTVYERTQVKSLVKKGPIRSEGSCSKEAAPWSLGASPSRVDVSDHWGSSPSPTEASLYRHDQTFNSIFRFSPFSRELWGEGRVC